MANGSLLVSVLLFSLVNGSLPSASFTSQSALTFDLCDPLQGGKEITIDIVAQNDESRKVTINGDGSTSHYEKNIPGAGLLQGDEYQFQFEQKTIKSVTVTSTANPICVNALVVDTIIVVDQPTDFMSTCPSSSPEDLERPCKQLGVSIDVSKLFVCPEQLKDLLLKEKLVQIKPGSQTTPDNEPPTYDITGDMLQASSAIAAGVVEGAGTITAARQKYREARRANPLQKLGTFAAAFETASTFISSIAPVFSIFNGIATIATTFLTPNPFDELAKYLDAEFKQINTQLTNIQADIADLGRLIEAKGGVLAMANQLSAIRYTIRNYGVLVDAISAKPVCGARELSKMPEVEQFMRQYQYDFVDNRLLDLYGVELGELVEATSLLTTYMMAYCRSKKHLVQKFAQELIYYGYAGLQSHFTYLSLLDATKGSKSDLEDKANTALMTKLYKFAKTAEVFREASLSEPGRALRLKFEDGILTQITKDEAGITDWLSERIINPSDWPYECMVKDANGQEKNSLVIQYRKINKIKDHWIGSTRPEQLLTDEPWDIPVRTEYETGSTYVRAPRGARVKNRPSDCKKPGTDNVMIVSYYPNPCCGEQRTVFVSWKKAAVCFYQGGPTGGDFRNCGLNEGNDCEFYGSKEMLDAADRF